MFVVAGCFALFIILFLFIFKPFGLDTLDKNLFITCVLVYGLVTFVAILAMIFLVPLVFPAFFKEENWTVGKELFFTLSVLFLIGLANYVVSHYLVGTSLKFENIVRFQLITLAIGFLPIVIFILIQLIQQLSKYREEASLLQKKLAEKNDVSPDDKKKVIEEPAVTNNLIRLSGDYQKENLAIPNDNFLYVSSASNYVKVHYIEKGNAVYSILRITMKRVEDVLIAYPHFFRCHRAYIINLDKVKEISGNAQGYKIKLEDVEELIPVSRNLNSEFADKVLAKKY